MYRAALLVALLVACGDSAPAEEPCLADELGQLGRAWKARGDCERETTPCHDDCVAGDGNACLNEAFALEAKETRSRHKSQELFRRACKLGLSLGCTNWAAGAWRFG